METKIKFPQAGGKRYVTFLPVLFQRLTSAWASRVRRGCRRCCPATSPSPSSASCSASCWCTAAGPTCACASSCATSSTRTSPSPSSTSGTDSSAASQHRWENGETIMIFIYVLLHFFYVTKIEPNVLLLFCCSCCSSDGVRWVVHYTLQPDVHSTTGAGDESVWSGNKDVNLISLYYHLHVHLSSRCFMSIIYRDINMKLRAKITRIAVLQFLWLHQPVHFHTVLVFFQIFDHQNQIS